MPRRSNEAQRHIRFFSCSSPFFDTHVFVYVCINKHTCTLYLYPHCRQIYCCSYGYIPVQTWVYLFFAWLPCGGDMPVLRAHDRHKFRANRPWRETHWLARKSEIPSSAGEVARRRDWWRGDASGAEERRRDVGRKMGGGSLPSVSQVVGADHQQEQRWSLLSLFLSTLPLPSLLLIYFSSLFFLFTSSSLFFPPSHFSLFLPFHSLPSYPFLLPPSLPLFPRSPLRKWLPSVSVLFPKWQLPEKEDK